MCLVVSVLIAGFVVIGFDGLLVDLLVVWFWWCFLVDGCIRLTACILDLVGFWVLGFGFLGGCGLLSGLGVLVLTST